MWNVRGVFWDDDQRLWTVGLIEGALELQSLDPS
jgi:hypothetical protein